MLAHSRVLLRSGASFARLRSGGGRCVTGPVPAAAPLVAAEPDVARLPFVVDDGVSLLALRGAASVAGESAALLVGIFGACSRLELRPEMVSTSHRSIVLAFSREAAPERLKELSTSLKQHGVFCEESVEPHAMIQCAVSTEGLCEFQHRVFEVLRDHDIDSKLFAKHVKMTPERSLLGVIVGKDDLYKALDAIKKTELFEKVEKH